MEVGGDQGEGLRGVGGQGSIVDLELKPTEGEGAGEFEVGFQELTGSQGEADLLMTAIRASQRKIFIFLFFVMNVVILLGSVMYLVEGQESGFDSIPRSIYWAIVTLTTVGYGDISPATSLGQFIAATIMVMGWGILAVPTGIVTGEISTASRARLTRGDEAHSLNSAAPCRSCGHEPREKEARFYSRCGSPLSQG